MSDYKKYTTQAKVAIKGEAFFESIISDYSIPHRVSHPKDIGIDYFCEWVCGDKPSGFLYAVQIKTLSGKYVKPRFLGIDQDKNKLPKYDVKSDKLNIDENTLIYWRGLGIPIYLFALIYSESSNQSGIIDCYYKRFTRLLTTPSNQDGEYFYKVNDGTSFLAFTDLGSKSFGFARDLFIDLIRCSYYKGSISYISPRSLGLNQFPEEESVFSELFDEYREYISKNIEQTKNNIKRYEEGEAIPSAAPPEDE